MVRRVLKEIKELLGAKGLKVRLVIEALREYQGLKEAKV
jgi:hypothetical protein